MGRLCDLSNEDIKKYKDIFVNADFLFGWKEEDCKKIVDGNRERLLFGTHPLFMVYSYDKNKQIVFNSFVVNDEGKVVSMTIEGYQINIDGNLVYIIDENGRHQSLQLARNENEPNFEVSANGVLVYMQYDSKQDKRVIIKYDQDVYGDNGIVFAEYLKNPFYVKIESKPILRDRGLFFRGRKDAYYRLDFDIYNNRWQYDLATLGEFGTAALSQDTIALHGGQREFSRYYKELFHIGDYFSLTGFPFLRQYKDEDIEHIIESLHFNTSVPSFVASIYNRRNEITEDFQSIIDEYRAQEKKLSK